MFQSGHNRAGRCYTSMALDGGAAAPHEYGDIGKEKTTGEDASTPSRKNRARRGPRPVPHEYGSRKKASRPCRHT